LKEDRVFDRLARTADRRSRLIGLIAIAVFLAAAVFGSGVAAQLGPYGAEDGRSESIKAEHLLNDSGFRAAENTVLITGVDVRGSASDRREVEQIRREVLRQPGVRDAVGFNQTRSPFFVSRDGRSTFIAVSIEPTDDREQQEVAAGLARSLEPRENVLLGGVALANEQVNQQVEKDLRRSEILVFPLLLLLSLVFFRSLTAAVLPLMVGALAIVCTFVGLRLASEVGSVSVYALNVTTGLGLGLAIDYSLFIVSRYREEIAVSGPGLPALTRTMNTAGRTVLFSSMTVAASMAALLIFPQRFLYSMGLGGLLVSLVSAFVALTVLPAVLSLLGDRVNSLAPGFLQRRERKDARGESQGFWYRLSRFVMKRPGTIATVTALGLIMLAVPAFRMTFAPVTAEVLPPGQSSRVVENRIDRDFPDAGTETIQVVLEGGSPQATAQISARIAAVPEVRSVRQARSLGPGLILIEAGSRAGYMDGPTRRAVEQIRELPEPTGSSIGVTGATARFLDFQQSLLNHLPLALLIIVSATLVILFLMTGSVVLPVKSLLMNTLTLGAVFGLLVLIFQDGNLTGPLGFESPGGIDQSTPILILALTFGLSTDYAVFLLSRIKEARDSGVGDSESVAIGLQRTGRIVTAAALLFAIAIGAFAVGDIVFIKELGVGTALAVLIDATIIRALLVPSLMALLGRRNWWAPPALRRLHDRWGVSHGNPGAEPESVPVRVSTIKTTTESAE
jgi:RND superfamily putative drug exporter